MAHLAVLGVMAAASLYKGYTAKRAAESEAAQLERNAGLEVAASQRAAEEERRRGRYIRSRALAVAGAQGGNLDDPTVVNILGDIQGESEYRALSQLYSGEQRALGLTDAATARRREGSAAMVGGILGAAGSAMQMGGGASTTSLSMFDRYGGGGPPPGAIETTMMDPLPRDPTLVYG